MQNFCQIAENFHGTMLDVKSGTNLIGPKNKQTWSHFLNSGGSLNFKVSWQEAQKYKKGERLFKFERHGFLNNS